VATYVVGDVHGQFRALEALWERLRFDMERDHLWMVGDLVNRGPCSLGVLRWARQLEHKLAERMVVVLGNHDLRLLAIAAGVDHPRKRDTLDDILAAADHDELIEWLRRRPLMYRRGADVLVHAGLLPQWAVSEAEARAREAEDVLQGADAAQLLADWRARTPVESEDRERRRQTLSVLTGIRTVDPEGRLSEHNGPPATAPDPFLPWFATAGRRSAWARVVFGHWAALGIYREPRVLALDSGAAWGGKLTAMRLEDTELIQEAVS
jgi:bis(5'-nucleosyl)-tetraphosphatase (symmetrical)